ncbi:MAG: TldD/PmbA family protein [Nitrososphaerota archaeon]|nr:TldD/PmbA family protein [Candidatus Bathyarchaeota archaeon]MDW8048608.1 TldD/PmbA family protein [Nitrososphaerota archaeon]
MRAVNELDLITPCERAASLLSKSDVDFFDVFASYTRSLNIEILGKGVSEARARTDVGLGVRVFKNKGMGIAFSQSLKARDVERIVRKAISFARMAQPDPYFRSIPGPSKAPSIPGLCDEDIINLSLGDAANLAERMIKAAAEVQGGAMYSGGLSGTHSKGYLLTSTGVSVVTEKTSVMAELMLNYRRDDDVGSSYEYDYAISLTEIDFEMIGRNAAQKALEQFGSKKLESGVMSVILTPESTSSLVFSLMAAISGESAVKARTFASSYLGKQIAPEMLEINDDGTIAGAVASSSYDGEGVPRRPLKVISRGRLISFLHNSYSAGIAGVESTGHAVRRGYGGNIGAGPTNIRVEPGDSSLDEMISETKIGVLATNVGFSPNMVSGEFSNTVDEGFFIKNGEKIHPIKNLMMGGHLLDLFRNIELISKEGRTIGKGFFFPSIKIGNVKFAGR